MPTTGISQGRPYFCGAPTGGTKTVNKRSETQYVDLKGHMEAHQHMSLHFTRTNMGPEAPPLPETPDSGESSEGPSPTRIYGWDDHRVPLPLQPTSSEGGLYKDEGMVSECQRLRSAVYLDHHQVDHSGAFRPIPEGLISTVRSPPPPGGRTSR